MSAELEPRASGEQVKAWSAMAHRQTSVPAVTSLPPGERRPQRTDRLRTTGRHELRHPIGKPGGHAAVVQRKIGMSGALHTFILKAAPDNVAGCSKQFSTVWLFRNARAGMTSRSCDPTSPLPIRRSRVCRTTGKPGKRSTTRRRPSSGACRSFGSILEEISGFIWPLSGDAEPDGTSG